MDQFNKAISFILGLVVVAVFIAVASGRINLKNKWPLFSKSTPTPTISITPTPTANVGNTQTSLLGNLFNFAKPKSTPTPTIFQNKVIPTTTALGNSKNSNTGLVNSPDKTYNQQPSGNSNNSSEYHSYTEVEHVSSIPNTGPALLLPFVLTSLFGGIYLKKRSRE